MPSPLTYSWPDVFTDPDFTYGESTRESRGKAIADGLSGWGICMAGNAEDGVPKQFGKAMVKIGQHLGIAPLAENLHAAADKWHKEAPDAT